MSPKEIVTARFGWLIRRRLAELKNAPPQLERLIQGEFLTLSAEIADALADYLYERGELRADVDALTVQKALDGVLVGLVKTPTAPDNRRQGAPP